MDTTYIYQKITNVLREVLENEAIEASPEMTASNVDEWDSFSHIRIILGVEQEFGVKFATPEIAKFENLGQLVELIAEKVSNN
jgi:acyl carrier protein